MLKSLETADLSHTNVGLFGIAAVRGSTGTHGRKASTILKRSLRQMLDSSGVESVGDLGTLEHKSVSKTMIEDTAELMTRAEKIAYAAFYQRDLLLTAGGDHSVSIATSKALLRKCKEQGLTLGIINLDAHADYNTLLAENDFQPLPGESGHPHGMWEAVACGDGHPLLVGIADQSAVMEPENVLNIGVNAVDKRELARIRKDGIQVVTMTQIAFEGLGCAKAAIDSLRKRVDVVLVSIDTDVLHYKDAPGTPMRNENGLSESAFIELCNYIGKECDDITLKAIDVVEYSARHDTRKRDTLRILTRGVACLMGVDYGPYQRHMAEAQSCRRRDQNSGGPSFSLSAIVVTTTVYIYQILFRRRIKPEIREISLYLSNGSENTLEPSCLFCSF